MSKETIKKLEKIRGHFINTSKGCVLANATNDMIAEWLDEVIAALKAEQPTISKSITDYIQCPDSECCGCLVKEKQTRGVVCNKCGKKWGLFPHRTNKFSKAKQPKDEAIKEAMEAVEQRREGRYKLVYDKSSRTIIAVPNPNYSLEEQLKAGELSIELKQAFEDIINHRKKLEDIDPRLLILAKVRIDRQKTELAKAKERIEAYEKRPAAIKCPKCKTIIKVV